MLRVPFVIRVVCDQSEAPSLLAWQLDQPRGSPVRGWLFVAARLSHHGVTGSPMQRRDEPTRDNRVNAWRSIVQIQKASILVGLTYA
jgi:hypothetical protein